MNAPSSNVTSVAEIEAAIGKMPGAIALKVIRHIDDHAVRWIGASPIAFLGFGGADGVSITIAGGAQGFAKPSKNELRVPLSQVDDAEDAKVGAGFGSLFLIPAKRETLRVNGTITAIDDDAIIVKVEECYGHCAKAFIRSGLWDASPREVASEDDWLSQTSFMVVATCDREGRTDVSPKGDPAGLLIRQYGDEVRFAERPGNRKADGFKNIVTQPHIALAAIVPGSPDVAMIKGAAQITTDEAMRNDFEVEQRTPKLVVRVMDAQITAGESAALQRAQLWPAEDKHPDIDAAKMFAAHMKANMGKGIGGRVASAALSTPGVVKTALNSDYKNNLY